MSLIFLFTSVKYSTSLKLLQFIKIIPIRGLIGVSFRLSILCTPELSFKAWAESFVKQIVTCIDDISVPLIQKGWRVAREVLGLNASPKNLALSAGFLIENKDSLRWYFQWFSFSKSSFLGDGTNVKTNNPSGQEWNNFCRQRFISHCFGYQLDCKSF